MHRRVANGWQRHLLNNIEMTGVIPANAGIKKKGRLDASLSLCSPLLPEKLFTLSV